MSNHFIVAIGSAAGGLNPMISFFQSASLGNAAYVILRHIPANQQSHLHTILQPHSKLRMVEAEDNTTIEKNTVYMPPAGMYMTIENDKLHLVERQKQTMFPNKSIDIFFHSLAKTRPGRCIGIIMSGIGTDGISGSRAIHATGGLILVQDPGTCEQRSMPNNVMATGIVQEAHVLDPLNMPGVVSQHIHQAIHQS